jgi:hypothetical protein
MGCQYQKARFSISQSISISTTRRRSQSTLFVEGRHSERVGGARPSSVVPDETAREMIHSIIYDELIGVGEITKWLSKPWRENPVRVALL